MYIGLRFPTQPTTLAEVMAHRAICLAAQRQAEDGQQVTVPDGVEVVYLSEYVPIGKLLSEPLQDLSHA